MTADDVGWAQWGCGDAEVSAGPHEVAHDRPHALRRGYHHCRRHHEARGDVRDVGHSPEHIAGRRSAINQRAHGDAQAEQVQQWLHERRQDVADPEPAENGRVPERNAHRTGCRHSHRQSTKVRPVRCKNTSSRLERRTKVLNGCRPRPWASDNAASPSSAYTSVRSGSTSTRSPRPITSCLVESSPFGLKRSSNTSFVECSSISERGEPVATIRPPSMTTRRSHSCSASSM